MLKAKFSRIRFYGQIVRPPFKILVITGPLLLQFHVFLTNDVCRSFSFKITFIPTLKDRYLRICNNWRYDVKNLRSISIWRWPIDDTNHLQPKQRNQDKCRLQGSPAKKIQARKLIYILDRIMKTIHFNFKIQCSCVSLSASKKIVM